MMARAAGLAIAGLAIAGLGGCGGVGLSPLGQSSSSSQGKGSADSETADFRGFSWVRPQLAGMPRPGARQPLEDDLAYLEGEGIEILVSLTETPTPEDAAQDHGMELIHIPVQDFTAPTQAQLLSFLDLTQTAMDSGTPVGVHCLGGHGRTGTFLAAWFVYEGSSADEALAEIRELRPGSVETATQEQALHDLELYLRPPAEPGDNSG